MILGFSYNLFDGEELLPYAIKQIRDKVDFISVVIQSVSNYGVKFNHLMDWKDQVDKVIFYQPDLSLTPRQNECIKRELGREASKEVGCTHHASLDVDEFYTGDQIELAKDMKEDASVVYYCNYFKSPCWKIIPVDKFMVSFIHKVCLKYDMNSKFRFPVDLTRRIWDAKNFKVYFRDEIEMHHMTFVRKNVKLKIQNSSLSEMYSSEIIDIHSKYNIGKEFCLPPSTRKKNTIKVQNLFNIPENIW